MSTITALAHATQPAAPVFNSDFYVTAATVIPVLYLALAVQGRAYDDALQSILRMNRNLRRRGFLGTLASIEIGIPLAAIASLVVAAGAVGEILAITALYHGHASSGTKSHVYLAVIILTAAAAIGPALTYTRFVIRDSLDGSRRPAEPEAEQQANDQAAPKPERAKRTRPKTRNTTHKPGT